MSYFCADANGYLGDVASINGLRVFRMWAQRHPVVTAFLDDGYTTDVVELVSVLDNAVATGDAESTRQELLAYARKANRVLIVSDGSTDEIPDEAKGGAGSGNFLAARLRSSVESKGGAGSGFFGHAGRPGEVGGSAMELAPDRGGAGGARTDAIRPVIEHLTDRMRQNTEKWQEKTGHTTEAMADRVSALYDRATDEQKAEGERWYREAHNEAVRIAAEHGLTPTQASGVIAALSPLRRWSANVQDAENVLRQVAEGKADPEVAKLFKANVEKAESIIRGADPNDVLWRGESGFKVRSFYANILSPDRPEVTVDTHMLRILLDDQYISSKEHGKYASNAGRYDVFRQAIINAAEKANVLPTVMQATTWVVQRDEQTMATVGLRRKTSDSSALSVMVDALGVVFAALPAEDDVERPAKGGAGSGNFGHAGRPGMVGGSSPDAADINRLNNDGGFVSTPGQKIAEAEIIKGGAGSGNFGHEGRPGLVGGSSPTALHLQGTTPQALVERIENSPEMSRAELQSVQEKVEASIRSVLGSQDWDVTVPLVPIGVKAGARIAQTLSDMKERGYAMPRAVRVVVDKEMRGEYIPSSGELHVFVPDSLPSDVDLDKAARAAFSPTAEQLASDVERPFSIKSFDDVVIHEMGHVAHFDNARRATGSKPDMKWGMVGMPAVGSDGGRTVVSVTDMKAIAASVSEYAKQSPVEFVAEAFVTQNHGTRLDAKAKALYRFLNGPEVKH